MKEAQGKLAYEEVRRILEDARSNAYHAVNFAMVKAYWEIGRVIVEEEQNGKIRAEYGKQVIKELSERLTKEYGGGFSERTLKDIRLFFLRFPIGHAVRAESAVHNAVPDKPLSSESFIPKLSWTHYRLLLKVDDDNAKEFYMSEAASNNWNTRELERQVNSHLFERLACSKDRKKVLEIAKKGQGASKPEDLIRDPVILDFLQLKDNYMEKDLEKALLDKLQDFMLALGKGFSFVARQKRISLDTDHYYIDLVFYNYILNCFVLVELKRRKLSHRDIGQMDFYVRYFDKEVKQDKDNPTVGLILSSGRNEMMVKYTLLEDRKNVFAAKYKLYLPTENELKELIN